MTKLPERFGIAKVCMGVHQPDLTPEIGGRFSALEDPHGSPAIDHRPIEQPRPIGALEVRFNEIKVLLGLLRRQHVVDHRMNHRKQAIAETGFMIQRVQQISHGLGILEIDVARDHPIDQKVLSKISQNLFGFNFQKTGQHGLPNATERGGEADQDLVVQGHGPRTAQMVAESRIRRLQRIIPIPVPIGLKTGSRNQSLTNQTQGTNQMVVNRQRLLLRLVRGKERHALLEERLIARGLKILRRG